MLKSTIFVLYLYLYQKHENKYIETDVNIEGVRVLKTAF